VVDLFQHVGGLAQADHGEEIRRHKKGKTVASSLGRNMEKIRPTGLAGLP
jgi:hypothetical protein